MAAKKIAPIHPGEVLLEDYMKPAGMSVNRLALELHVAPSRIGEIVKGERAITADTALRLARYYDTSAALWLGMQMDYDLAVAQDALAETIEREVRARRA